MSVAETHAGGELGNLLRRYYQREAWCQPKWARSSYNVSLRVERNLAASKARSVFPVSFVAREVELQGSRVLDAGCGTGHTAIAFASEGACVTAIDMDDLALEIGLLRSKKEQVKVDFIKQDITQLQFDDGVFDVVLSHQVLEHMVPWQQVQALQQMWRTLRPGGILFIQTPNRLFPLDMHDSQLPGAHWLPHRAGRFYARLFRRIPPHVYLMTWSEIAEVLGPGGFELVNKCDMYHDLADFGKAKRSYTDERSWRSRLYFSLMVPLLFRVLLFVGLPYVTLAPNLNLLLRKMP